MLRPAIILVLLGATFGSLFDWLHVKTGAIAYAKPTSLGIAWWVPLLYSTAALAIGLSHPMADRLLGRVERVAHTRARLVFGFVAFCAIWFATGALPFSSAIVAAMLAPVSLAIWFALDRTWQGLLLASSTAVFGFAFEALLSRLGLFRHIHPDVLGIAIWLPTIYVAASVGIGNLGRALTKWARPGVST